METNEPKSWAGAMLKHVREQQKHEFESIEDLLDWSIDQCGEYYYGKYHHLFDGTMDLHFCIRWMNRFILEINNHGFELWSIKQLIIDHNIINNLYFVHQHPVEPETVVGNILRRIK